MSAAPGAAWGAGRLPWSVAGGWLLGLLAAACMEPEPDPLPPPDACFSVDGWDRHQCLTPWAVDLTEQEGARFAVCRVGRLQRDGEIDDCHALAHVIGQTTLALHDGDAGAAFASCGSGCVEGCLHGVMESFVPALAQDPIAVAEAVYPLCDVVSHETWYPCVHGVGHGLRYHGFLSLADAVAVCQGADDPAWAEVCLGGVFMEQVDWLLPDPLENLAVVLPMVCGELEGTAVFESCLLAIGEGLMFRTAHDLDRSRDLCLRLADTAEIEACWRGAEDEAALNQRVDPVQGDCD